MTKPIIIGLSNPHSPKTEDALAPYPERSSGWRLAKMLKDFDNTDFVHYLYGFDRRNLLPHDTVRGMVRSAWRARAKISGGWMVKRTIPKGSTVVVLGHDVLDAISPHLSSELKSILIHPQVIDGVTWRWLPHPSGRCTHYNDAAMRTLAGMLLADVLKQSAQEK